METTKSSGVPGDDDVEQEVESTMSTTTAEAGDDTTGAHRVQLDVDGMSCAACAGRV